MTRLVVTPREAYRPLPFDVERAVARRRRRRRLVWRALVALVAFLFGWLVVALR